MDEIGKLVSNQGLAVAIVVVVLVGCAWIGVRLFGKEGILSRFADSLLARVLAFFDKAESVAEDTRQSVARMVDSSEQQLAGDRNRDVTLARMDDADGRLCRAGLHACDVLEEISAKTGADTLESIARIRSELQHPHHGA